MFKTEGYSCFVSWTLWYVMFFYLLRKKNYFDGILDGCENKQCDFYAICAEVEKNARCVCPKVENCDGYNGTVCGTDGVTYSSECALRVAACEAKQYVLIAYKGDCGKFNKTIKYKTINTLKTYRFMFNNKRL